jgi:LPXTG-site transpeptidase (sortase) family protein
MTRWARVALGLALVWGALGVVGYRLGWEIHASRGRTTLLGSAHVVVRDAADCTSGLVTPSSDGVLAGVLQIPTLGVTAPVESGTSNQVLAVAVGHFDATPWPGQAGTAALLAHDVSYFARIDQLVPGDRIVYRSGCVSETFTVTGHQIVQDGAPVPALAGTTLVLDTCWPTDALWYTPNRYLVEAVESGISVGGHPTSGATAAGGQSAFPIDFSTPAPPALQATGLALTDNEEPMGTLTFAGDPSPQWTQSPAPLALQTAALADFFGGYHAAAADQQQWWAAIAPGVPMPAALVGATPTLSDASPLNVTITANGDQPTQVLLSTVVPLTGGTAPGTYYVQVAMAVHGTTVVITHWGLTHD